MPLINDNFSFTPEDLALIETIEALPDYNHKKWTSDSLQDLRVRIRDFYREKQNYTCPYCKGNVSITSAFNAQVEHIVPKALHIEFMFTPHNLCVICADCNTIKSNKEVNNEHVHTTKNADIKRYPTSSNAFKIVHPHFDNYDEHITIIANEFYIENNDSEKGRFTIFTCKLNKRFALKYNRNEETLIDDTLSTTFQVFSEAAPTDKKVVANTLLQSLLQ